MVTVNQETCIGCGACAAVCGEVFEMKDAKAEVKAGADASKPCVKEAIDGCPVDAIS
jgi:ferredoxin